MVCAVQESIDGARGKGNGREQGLTLIAPPLAGHSTEMLSFATAKSKIIERHLESALLPREVYSGGRLVALDRRTPEPPVRP